MQNLKNSQTLSRMAYVIICAATKIDGRWNHFARHTAAATHSSQNK